MPHVQSDSVTQAVIPAPPISTTLSEALRENLRAEMARREVSQASLAAALGITQQAYSRRMRGLVPFDVTELDRIASLLGLDPRELLTPARSGS